MARHEQTPDDLLASIVSASDPIQQVDELSIDESRLYVL